MNKNLKKSIYQSKQINLSIFLKADLDKHMFLSRSKVRSLFVHEQADVHDIAEQVLVVLHQPRHQ